MFQEIDTAVEEDLLIIDLIALIITADLQEMTDMAVIDGKYFIISSKI